MGEGREGIGELVAELARELIGLAPVKKRIAEIAALLAVDKARAARSRRSRNAA